MGFLAPAAPLLGKLGGSIGMSLLGNALNKANPNSAEQRVLNNDAAAQQSSLTAGQNLLGMGQGAVQKPLDYWSNILSGNRGLATSAIAPDIQRIGEGYQQAAKTSAALNQRGGPSVTALANNPWQQQRDVSTMFQQLRPQAASQLGSLGTQLLGQGANSIYASTAAGRDILGEYQNLRNVQTERGKGIGGGLFSMWQQSGAGPFGDWLGSIFKNGPSPGAAQVGENWGTGESIYGHPS